MEWLVQSSSYHFIDEETEAREGKWCWHSHSLSYGRGRTGRKTPSPPSGLQGGCIWRTLGQFSGPDDAALHPFSRSLLRSVESMSPPLRSGLLDQMERGRVTPRRLPALEAGSAHAVRKPKHPGPVHSERPQQPAPLCPPAAWEPHLANGPLTPLQPPQLTPPGTEKCCHP